MSEHPQNRPETYPSTSPRLPEKKHFDTSIPEEAMDIIHRLQQAGFQACLAGGCVRDFLLGKTAHDWDVATSATPDQIEQLFPQNIPVGKAFGIVVVLSNGKPFEVATFRGDGVYKDGRHPEQIFFASLEEDVKRRDFTVNAMLYDPIAKHLYDFVEGQQDLNHKILRSVGNPWQRFQEDKLRLLRAIRFAANLHFTIEEKTWQALCLECRNIKLVSRERIAAELEKMLLGGHSASAFQLLNQSGLLQVILPSVAAMQDVAQPPEFHPEGDVWQHTLIMLSEWDKTLLNCSTSTPSQRFKDGQLTSASALEKRILAWAVLLHDIGKPETFQKVDRIRFNGHDCLGAELAKEILLGLKLPKNLIDGVHTLVRQHMSLTSFPMMREANRRRKLQETHFPLLLELHRLDSLGSHKILSLHKDILQAWQTEQSRPIPPQPLLNGKDLLQLGYQPGPIFSSILKAVQDATLENTVKTREEALKWINEHFPKT
ncbi:MAG: CCA tRNA nucleotidyltransferase [Lentisphaeria bacterium]